MLLDMVIENQTLISFQGGENNIVEARAPHLRGKTVVIAESDESGKITTDWNKIYLPN